MLPLRYLYSLIKKGSHARYVQGYFSEAATGKNYQEFDRRFNAIVDELSAE